MRKCRSQTVLPVIGASLTSSPRLEGWRFGHCRSHSAEEGLTTKDGAPYLYSCSSKELRKGQLTGPRWSSWWLAMMVRVLVSLALLGCLLFPGSVPSLSELAPAEIMELSSVDSCGQVLEVPKIALLFLIKGPLYHGEMWEKWFESAQDMVPKEKVQEVLSCEEGGRDLLAAEQQFYSANATRTTAPTAAGAPRDGASKRNRYNSYDVVGACGSTVRQSCVQKQHLYSLYIHLRSDLDVSVLDGMWHPYLGNVSRVLTRWGTHSLVEATRNLLWNAYRDPLNQRFVLLSESHIPIWDPFVSFCRCLFLQYSNFLI